MEKSLIVNEPIEVEAEEVFKVKINGKYCYLTKEEYDKYKERIDYLKNYIINKEKRNIILKRRS
jgi:hypothetical protein